MNENRRRILDMLAEGKISADEAERLLSLVEQASAAGSGASVGPRPRRGEAKYLRVTVEPNAAARAGNGGDRVNIRVPMALIRAGMKLSALIPSNAATGINEALKGKGIDMDVRNLKADDLEQLMDALAELEIDVQDDEHKVRIFVE